MRVQLATWMGIACLGIGLMVSEGKADSDTAAAKPLPVILDTDIGDDIDDSWALAMLLKCPEFDIKLITTTNGKAEYRAKLIAKTLAAAGRTDIPIGLGAGGREGGGPVEGWVKDYKLSDYPGKIYEDGAKAVVETVNLLAEKKTPATIIAIGPLHTLEAALALDSGIAAKADFVGMHGSVRKGYENNPQPCVEYNMAYAAGAKKVFSAPWHSFTFTPLDTCGLVKLEGTLFSDLKSSKDPVVQALLENYRIWSQKNSVDDLSESSILFDTVAIYLAVPGPKPLLELESLRITVTDDGMTVIDPKGMPMTVATDWKDLAAYREYLVKRLLAPSSR